MYFVDHGKKSLKSMVYNDQFSYIIKKLLLEKYR